MSLDFHIYLNKKQHNQTLLTFYILLIESDRMKITLTVIKADIGSVGGHTKPSKEILDAFIDHIHKHGKKLFIDSYINYTGDDIHVLLSPTNGTGNAEIHKLAFDAFM